MADSYEINLEIQGGEQPELVMETEGGATDGASARNAEAWANGTRNGVPVGENDPAYNKNGKYYRDSAAAIAAGDVIDDDAGHGDKMLAWSADKLVGEFGSKHEDFTAGNALFLLSDRGETDNEPYTFRKTGGSKNAYGREMLKKLVGETVAWNQIAMFTSAKVPTAGHDITYTSVDNKAVKINGTASAIEDRTGWFNISESTIHYGHKYLFAVKKLSGSYTGTVKVSLFGSSLMAVDDSAIIVTCPNSGGQAINYRHRMYIDSGAVCNNLVITFICVDLTQMFGSTIADAIYAMEQATAGAGVAWFKKLFPKNYYAYDAGTLMSVNAESHRLTGFNQWDEEWRNGYYNTNGTFTANSGYVASKNPISVLPSTAYCFATLSTANIGRICWYNKEMQFISTSVLLDTRAIVTSPGNAYYLNFDMGGDYGTTYKNDICINLSNTAKNGTYEPYQLRSYPLANVELRGVPQWENGQLVFDGDEYTPDGTVKRRYGIVDLGTLTWSYSTDRVPRFGATFPYDAKFIGELTAIKGISSEYKLVSFKTLYDETQSENRTIAGYSSTRMAVRDDAYTDAASFKTAMSGVYFVYELATPTTESADPYRELQISNRNGTEEFIDRAEEAGSRDVAIPVGTETFYPVDVFALIDSLQAMILENISNS